MRADGAARSATSALARRSVEPAGASDSSPTMRAARAPRRASPVSGEDARAVQVIYVGDGTRRSATAAPARSPARRERDRRARACRVHDASAIGSDADSVALAAIARRRRALRPVRPRPAHVARGARGARGGLRRRAPRRGDRAARGARRGRARRAPDDPRGRGGDRRGAHDAPATSMARSSSAARSAASASSSATRRARDRAPARATCSSCAVGVAHDRAPRARRSRRGRGAHRRALEGATR